MGTQVCASVLASVVFCDTYEEVKSVLSFVFVYMCVLHIKLCNCVCVKVCVSVR